MIEASPPFSVAVPVAETRPEIQLLLCCARTSVDAERAQRLRTLLQGDLDWVFVLETAFHHSVMPLLYWNLQATCAEAVPEPVLEHLRRRFHANTARNLLLIRELLRLLSLLEEYGIPAIPYKGPVLATAVYNNFALRQCGDLDILIAESDVLRAKELLLSQGYRLQYQSSSTYEALFRHLRQTYDLLREDEQILVELHWNIISWPMLFPPSSAFLWERPEVVSLAHVPVRTLAPEDVLPILCIHGAKHYWERLGWICDVAELVHMEPGIDWERVLAHAGRLRAERMLYLGLSLAQSLLGAAVPTDIVRRIQLDRFAPSLAKRVRSQLFAGTDGLLRKVEQHASYLKLEERLQDKLRCGIYLLYRLIARLLYYVIGPRLWRPDKPEKATVHVDPIL
jgi:hypothetical protein